MLVVDHVCFLAMRLSGALAGSEVGYLWRGAGDLAERRTRSVRRTVQCSAFEDVADGEVHFFNANGREYPRIFEKY